MTNSSVGSFAGTSGLEGTTVWPFERKYSRKLERISLDFIARILPAEAKKPAERQRGKTLGRREKFETSLTPQFFPAQTASLHLPGEER